MNLETPGQSAIIDTLSQETLEEILKALESDPHCVQDVLKLQEHVRAELNVIVQSFLLENKKAAVLKLADFMDKYQIKELQPPVPLSYKRDKEDNILPRFISG